MLGRGWTSPPRRCLVGPLDLRIPGGGTASATAAAEAAMAAVAASATARPHRRYHVKALVAALAAVVRADSPVTCIDARA